MHHYGGLAAPLAALAVFLLAAFLSMYLAGAAAFYARWRRGRALADALLFGALWLLAELARAVIFTGFPWLASGYAQIDGPLARLAPWVGVYGIGAVMAVLAALPGAALSGPARLARHTAPGRAKGRTGARALLGCGPAIVIVCGLALAPQAEFSRPAGRMAVSLLQTNVPQEQKFETARLDGILERLSEALLGARGELVIAPETAIPVLPGTLGEDWWQPLRRRFAEPGRVVLLGLPLWGEPGRSYTNSVIGLDAQAMSRPGQTYRYDKHHLVPFGEFIPFGFRWFTNLMHIPLGDFARGPVAAPSFGFVARDGSSQRVAPNICYEDLFGEELAARFGDPAQAPTVFSNHSNIAWFGDTSAVVQHLHISRMRTLEFERPMLRSTNTGATAAIDHRGQVLQMLPAFTRDVLEVEIEARDGLTPFARWASSGLWPLLLPAWLVVAASLFRRGTRPGAARPRP